MEGLLICTWTYYGHLMFQHAADKGATYESRNTCISTLFTPGETNFSAAEHVRDMGFQAQSWADYHPKDSDALRKRIGQVGSNVLKGIAGGYS